MNPIQASENIMILETNDCTSSVPGLHLDLDKDFQAAGCFTEVIRGYQMGVVEPDVMRGLQPST